MMFTSTVVSCKLPFRDQIIVNAYFIPVDLSSLVLLVIFLLLLLLLLLVSNTYQCSTHSHWCLLCHPPLNQTLLLKAKCIDTVFETLNIFCPNHCKNTIIMNFICPKCHCLKLSMVDNVPPYPHKQMVYPHTKLLALHSIL